MRNIKVYIASPYTKGDVIVNVRKSIDAFIELNKLGFIPFSPLAMCHTIHMVEPLGYDEWLSWDFEWVKSCDALLRLPGESYGADKEIECAKKNNIKVFYSIKDLKDYYSENDKIDWNKVND